MFLNLLVAQIQNQDPLNPSDSTQFVSQLAQFSELEQVIGIRSDTDTLASSASSSTAAASSATSANTATTTTTNSTTSN
jgi:flagellar basal-body rod modification protein FlgD